VEETNKRRQIRNLLIVFLGGIVFALFLAALTLYHYSPSGRYSVNKILLAPDVLFQGVDKGAQPKKGKKDLLVVEQMEFSSYDSSSKTWKKTPISRDLYAKFYEMISKEISLAEVPQETIDLFNYYPSSLTLNVNINNPSDPKPKTKIFQQVNFVKKGDYFRIALLEQNTETRWAYFYYPQIDQKVLSLFTNL